MVDITQSGLHQNFLTRTISLTLEKVRVDPVLTGLLVLLATFGLFVLHSALGKDSGALLTQMIRIFVALVLLFVASSISPVTYFRLTPFLYAVSILLLMAVMFFGYTAQGSQRWLDLPGLPRFQPSELLKITIPLMMAWFICRRELKLRLFDYLILMAIVLLPASLLFFQPDYGTALLLMIASCGIVFLMGIKWRWIVTGFVMFLISLPLVWNYVLYEYHRNRILTLFDPEGDPRGAGWQIIQSKTAIGSGGLTGKGLYEGTQSHLDFLPDGHTDFILAVIGEELGFMWCTLLLLCYLSIFIRGMYLGVTTTNAFSNIAISGITMIFFIYVIVNVAMVLGLLPVIGAPLPLVSYGGTAAMTTTISFGIIMALVTKKDWTDK